MDTAQRDDWTPLTAQWLNALALSVPSPKVLAISVDIGVLASYAIFNPGSVKEYALGPTPTLLNALVAPDVTEPVPTDGLYDCVLADFSYAQHEFGPILADIRGRMRLGAYFCCVLPLGLKKSAEYPYFFSSAAIQRMIRSYGFSPISQTICPDLVHGGYASCLLSVLMPTVNIPYFDDSRWLRRRFEFVPHSDASFEYRGTWGLGAGGEWISKSPAASLIWHGDAAELLIVFERHPWSGIGEFYVKGKRTNINLFSWFAHTQPEAVYRSRVGEIAIRLTGRSIGTDPASLGREIVIHGLLKR